MAIQVTGTQVISNARALTNIASIDATTAAAITAAGVGGGGEIDFVASGTLSNGATVGVNQDGTISVTTPLVGEATAYVGSDTLSAVDVTVVYDATSGKLVASWQSDNYQGKASLGTISGSTITWGSNVTFHSQNGQSYCIANAGAGKVAIFWRHNNAAGNIYAIVGTISGTSLTFGTATSLGPIANAFRPTYDTSTGKVVIFYRDDSTGYAVIRVCTISGTSISAGSQYSVGSYYGNPESFVYCPSINKFVGCLRDYNTNPSGTYAFVATISGTSASYGTVLNLGVNKTYMSLDWDSNNSKILLAYADTAAGNTGKITVGTVSGTSISFGTAVAFATTGVANFVSYNPTAGKFVLTYSTVANASGTTFAIPVTVSGSTASAGGSTAIVGTGSDRTCAAYDAPTGYTSIVLNTINNGKGSSNRYNPTSTLTSFVGITAAAIANGATGPVTIIGGTNESLTGLIVGGTYGVPSSTGVLTATTENKIGVALSATKLLINGSI